MTTVTLWMRNRYFLPGPNGVSSRLRFHKCRLCPVVGKGALTNQNCNNTSDPGGDEPLEDGDGGRLLRLDPVK